MDPKDQTQKSEELTDKQKRLLSILIETPNITEAAQRAGIGRSTAHRWLQEPVFRSELTRQRNALMEETMGSLKSYTAKATEQLIQLLDSKNEWVRRQTCKDILGYAFKVREIENVEERLEAIEKAMKRNNPNPRRG